MDRKTIMHILHMTIISFLTCKCKSGEGKVVPVLNEAPCHEDIVGSGDTAPCIPDLGTKMEVSCQLCALAALPQGKRPGTHMRGNWVVPRVGLDTMVKRKIPNPCQESNPTTCIIHPVA
jgi:hypothetical protein